MAEESKSQASRVASEVAPTEQNSTTVNDVNDEDQGPVFGQDQYQSQAQFGGGGKGKCMCNPCKCCCGGNLRSACFAISITEFVFGIGTLFLTIAVATHRMRYSASKSSSMENGNAGTSYTGRNKEATDKQAITNATIFLGNLTLVMLVAAIFLLLAVIKRFKWAAIVHAACTTIMTIFNVFLVILIIIVLAIVETIKKEICANADPDYTNTGDCPMKTFLIVAISLLLIFFLFFATLWAYFTSNSIALYCHYKNGTTYEGTSLCSCCGRGRNQMQPQYQFQQYQYVDQYQYDPSQSQNQMQPQEAAPSYK